MTLDAYIALAESLGYSVAYSSARPMGGWDRFREVGKLQAYLDEENEERAENGVEPVTLDDALETSVVLALAPGETDSIVDGRPVGAWTPEGWFLGSGVVSVEVAYRRVFANGAHDVLAARR